MVKMETYNSSWYILYNKAVPDSYPAHVRNQGIEISLQLGKHILLTINIYFIKEK
jgi:hypothetical protein